jgi:hypothetical protein
MKGSTWLKSACAVALAIFIGTGPALATPWSFGVMSDTQWIGANDGKNPNSVAVGIINQITPKFVSAGVKFVVQVGDLTDNGSSAAMTERANAAQALYSAGIGFYPLIGNHESSQAAAQQFQQLYPQTQGNGSNVFGATNFGSPTTPSGLTGLSYSFDYQNARFVLLDQFTRTTGTGSSSSAVNNTNIADQQAWISSTLAGRPAGSQAFVFGHKNLIGQNHTDVLLGANPGANAGNQNAFIGSLASNGVRYYVSGHDHIHQRSVVTSPDGASKIQQIISGSDSSKFYVPLGNTDLTGGSTNNPALTNDRVYNGTPGRETSVRQERNAVGYYIYTVDGPRVKVDYYSAPSGATLQNGEYLITSTPTLTFTKQETFGYSLNGKEFLVGGAYGTSYNVVQDSYGTTAARILGGTYSNTATDGSGRILTQAIDTGWTDKSGTLRSDALSLWGLQKGLGSGQTDIYALSMSFAGLTQEQMASGMFFLLTKDANGNWVNAVDTDFGTQTKHFVVGSWDAGYGLGTYGIDPTTSTAWAVINHDSDFAVGQPVPLPAGLFLMAPGLLGVIGARRRFHKVT